MFLLEEFERKKADFNPDVIGMVENWSDYKALITTIKKIAALDVAKLEIDVNEFACYLAQTAWANHIKFRSKDLDDETITLIQKANELANDPVTQGFCCYVQSTIYRGKSQLAQAESLMHDAMAHFAGVEEFSNSTLEAQCLNNLGLVQMWLGKHDDAQVHFIRALECTNNFEHITSRFINRAEGVALVRTKMNVSQLYKRLDDYDQSLAYAREAASHNEGGELAIAYRSMVLADALRLKASHTEGDEQKQAFYQEALTELTWARQAYEAAHEADELAENNNYLRALRGLEAVNLVLAPRAVPSP